MKFIERVQEFEAMVFNYDDPAPILNWLRSKGSEAEVVFRFPQQLTTTEEIPYDDMTRLLRVEKGWGMDGDCFVYNGDWLIHSWPMEAPNRKKWTTMTPAQFDLTFKKSDD